MTVKPDEPDLVTSPEAITAAADDFGHLVHRVPAAVARPRDPAEVAALLRHAATAAVPLRARGGGHSVAGQAQCGDGIVCDLINLNDVHCLLPDRLTAGAGSRWSTVLAASWKHGLTPPVLTDSLDLTVGGTLSAGGLSGTSHQHGPQVDHVLELEVVTAAGDIVSCSPAARPDVFFGALAGQGRAGIITRATLPLVPAHERARVCTISFPSLDTLVASQLAVARERRFSYLEGQIIASEPGQWSYHLEAATFYSGEAPAPPAGASRGPCPADIEELGYLAFCHRLTPGIRLLAATGDWYRPHPWLSVFLPCDAVRQYVADALAGLAPQTLGPLPVLLYPLRRGQVPAPGLPTPAGDSDGLFYLFSILRTVTGGPEAVAAALDHNQRLARAAADIGGTIYQCASWPALTGRGG